MIERVTDKSLWWQKDEMEAIRNECSLLVEEYTLYKREFERDVTALMERANEANLADLDRTELECFKEHEDARGLERHIVLEFETAKQMHFEAIMDAQHEYRQRGTTERWKYLKRVSLAASLSTRYIGVRFAQHDHILVQDERPVVRSRPKVVAPPLLSSPGSPTKPSSPRRNFRSFIQRTVSRRFSTTK